MTTHPSTDDRLQALEDELRRLRDERDAAIAMRDIVAGETDHLLKAAQDRFLAQAQGLQDANAMLAAQAEVLRKQQVELIRSQEDLRQHARGVEAEVERRTAELDTVNHELEAFSYSVSHDLRAPLRAIEGFALALDEDYGACLDEQGRDYLDRVRAAAKRMAGLIDDLLGLARLSRQEMRREPVDLSALARIVAAELLRAAPERSVTWRIEDGLTALGDTPLLRVALVNLLGNALKYSAPCPESVIEFGRAATDGGDEVFHVTDNGVGFDMTYADKLFQPFQRLHTNAQFPGTGVGLATVQRIVKRHGGRIWARSELQMGATFNFTLGGPMDTEAHRA